jgi:hypothetical protein
LMSSDSRVASLVGSAAIRAIRAWGGGKIHRVDPKVGAAVLAL